jgi:hypothetical protein
MSDDEPIYEEFLMKPGSRFFAPEIMATLQLVVMSLSTSQWAQDNPDAMNFLVVLIGDDDDT